MRNLGLMVMVPNSAPMIGGCASVLNGTKMENTTETRLAGARARFTAKQVCERPCKLEMKWENDQWVTDRQTYKAARSAALAEWQTSWPELTAG